MKVKAEFFAVQKGDYLRRVASFVVDWNERPAVIEFAKRAANHLRKGPGNRVQTTNIDEEDKANE